MSGSQNWTAIGTKPSDGSRRATLRVTGVVDLPDPDASAELVKTIAGAEGGLQMLRLIVTPGGGAAAGGHTPAALEWEGSVPPTTTHALVIGFTRVRVRWE